MSLWVAICPGLRRSDYMAVPDDGLDELEPVMTIVGGEIAYEKRGGEQ